MNLGAGELLIVAIVALIVLGPDKLPTAARNLAKFYREVRTFSQSVRTQVEDALEIDEKGKKSPGAPDGPSENPANPDVSGFRLVDEQPMAYRPPEPTADGSPATDPPVARMRPDPDAPDPDGPDDRAKDLR